MLSEPVNLIEERKWRVLKLGLCEGSSGRWEECGWLVEWGHKQCGCAKISRGLPQAFVFHYRPKALFETFFFFNSTFISYLLGLTGNTGVIVWASFLTPVVWLM